MTRKCLLLIILVFCFLRLTIEEASSDQQGTFLRDLQTVPCSCHQAVSNLDNRGGDDAPVGENSEIGIENLPSETKFHGATGNFASDATFQETDSNENSATENNGLGNSADAMFQGGTSFGGSSAYSSNYKGSDYHVGETQETGLRNSGLNKRDTQDNDVLDCQCGVQCSCPHTCSCRQKKSVLTPSRGQSPPYLINKLSMRHEPPWLTNYPSLGLQDGLPAGLPARDNEPQVVSRRPKSDGCNFPSSPPSESDAPFYPSNERDQAPLSDTSHDTFVQRSPNDVSNSQLGFSANPESNNNDQGKRQQSNVADSEKENGNPGVGQEASGEHRRNVESKFRVMAKRSVNTGIEPDAPVKHQSKVDSNSLVDRSADVETDALDDVESVGVHDDLASMTNDRNDLSADGDMGTHSDYTAEQPTADKVSANHNDAESGDRKEGVSEENIAGQLANTAESGYNNERASENHASSRFVSRNGQSFKDSQVSMENELEKTMKSDSSARNSENDGDSLNALDSGNIQSVKTDPVDSGKADGVDSGLAGSPIRLEVVEKTNSDNSANSMDSESRTKVGNAESGNVGQNENEVDSAGADHSSGAESGAFIRDVQNVPCAKHAFSDQDDAEWVRNAASVPYSKEDDILLRNSASPMVDGNSAESRSIGQTDSVKEDVRPVHNPLSNDNGFTRTSDPRSTNDAQLKDEATDRSEERGEVPLTEVQDDGAELERSSLNKRDIESNVILDCQCGVQCSCPHTCSCRQRKSILNPARGQSLPYLINSLASQEEPSYLGLQGRDNEPQVCDNGPVARCQNAKGTCSPNPTPRCRPNCPTRPPPCCNNQRQPTDNRLVAPGSERVEFQSTDNALMVKGSERFMQSDVNRDSDSSADQAPLANIASSGNQAIGESYGNNVKFTANRGTETNSVGLKSGNTAQSAVDQGVKFNCAALKMDDNTEFTDGQTVAKLADAKSKCGEEVLSTNQAGFSEDMNDLSLKDTLDALSVKKEMPPTDEVLNIPDNNEGKVDNAPDTAENTGNVGSTDAQDNGDAGSAMEAKSVENAAEVDAPNEDSTQINKGENGNVEPTNGLESGEYSNKLESGNVDFTNKLSARNSANPGDMTSDSSKPKEKSAIIDVNVTKSNDNLKLDRAPESDSGGKNGSNLKSDDVMNSMERHLVVKTVENGAPTGSKQPITFREVNPREYELGRINPSMNEMSRMSDERGNTRCIGSDYNEEIRSKRDLLDTMETIQPVEDTRGADDYSR